MPRLERPEHRPLGDPCELCHIPASMHRKRRARHDPRSTRERIRYIGIDGEGQGEKDHRYVLLAASDETGDVFSEYIQARPGERLYTTECLDFILEIPSHHTKTFAFSFGYDLTKILTDLDDESLFFLMRPELRKRIGKNAIKGPWPIKWNGYELNLQSSKFTVKCGKRRTIIWDVFRFFACKFTKALEDWKIGTKEELAEMVRMKDLRSEFDRMGLDEVRAYCFDECRKMATLARKLIEAHEAAGLVLRAYYGAGSSGGAMLDVMGIRERLVAVPKDMTRAVACAFSGGRFENSVIGPIERYVYGKDISSAYPYQTTFLPCLEHATWRLTTDRSEVEKARAALVRYHLGKDPGYVRTKHGKTDNTSWGPFPFRTEDGSICYPIESGGGWVWRDEFLAGARIFPHVHFDEAWVYESECKCQPFLKIPEYYIERIKLGKEGPGIVIKLGVNSCYGKLAQSVGNAIFNNWIWAGMITSGCRAQILELLWLHKRPSSLLMVATDGIATLEELESPQPRSTGTDGTGKPLGGWENKDSPRGLFIARPGIYFPLQPTEADLKEVKGRGVGRKEVFDNWKRIQNAYMKGWGSVDVANVRRFCGAKTSISFSKTHGYTRAARFGQWEARKIEMGFDPRPKRERVLAGGKLELRKMPRDLFSHPYDRALSPEALEMKQALEEQLEQPDGDFVNFEGLEHG